MGLLLPSALKLSSLSGTLIGTPPLTVGYSYDTKQATDISSMSITYGISICQRKVIKNAEMKKVSILGINMV